MQVHEGKVGRVFALKLEEGDHLIADLGRFAEERKIRTALVLFQGATGDARMVLGFRPYSSRVRDFDRISSSEHREVIGLGSITWANGKPKVHLHAGTGRGREVFIAHIEEALTFGMEAFVVELLGADLSSASLL
jgi:predicted DNA-binding protein with PD1-like motif